MWLSLMLRARQFETEDDHQKIEMWLKCVILAIFTVAGGGLWTPKEQDVHLDAKEKKLDVHWGSSLILHCCLDISNLERCRVNFIFESLNQTHTENPKYIEQCSGKDPRNCNLTNGCQTTCPLLNISERNNGFYSCKVIVEIPTLTEITSNKTEIALENFMEKTTVQSQTTKTQGISIKPTEDNLWMWVLVGVSSFILILIILLVIWVAQKRQCNQSIAEEPTYMNIRTVNKSPRLMSVDNGKTVSSQDLKTPSSARRYDEGNQRYKC